MEDVETILLTPEPTERPKEVCREETVSSSENQSAKPTLSDPWEPHLGPLSDSWVLEYFGTRMAERAWSINSFARSRPSRLIGFPLSSYKLFTLRALGAPLKVKPRRTGGLTGASGSVAGEP